MSVVSVTQMWSKKGGALSSRLLSSIDQVWSLTEGYSVEAAIGDDQATIAVGLGIAIGDAHATVPNAFVESITPQKISPIYWIVTVAYRGLVSEDGVEIEWTDVTTTEPIDRDINGDAIVTVNGEPVDGLTMDVSDQVAVIRRKFLTVDPAGIAPYRRATNSDTFLGWPPGTARLVAFSAKNKFLYSGAQEQWDVTARIQFREPYANTTAAQAWYKRWRHEGYYELVSGVVRRALDEQGKDMTKPVLLASDGTRETDPSAAYFVHTQVYDSLPYSALGLI